jgi:hypothetical protein
LRPAGVAPGHDRWCQPIHYSSLPNCYHSSAASPRPHCPRRLALAKKTSPSFLTSSVSELAPLRPADLTSAAGGCCDAPQRYLHPQSHKAGISPVGPGRAFYNVPQLQRSTPSASAPDCHQTARNLCYRFAVFTTRRSSNLATPFAPDRRIPPGCLLHGLVG